MKCKYCNKKFKSGSVLGGHTIHCLLNPNKKKNEINAINATIKAKKGTKSWNNGLTKNTDDRLNYNRNAIDISVNCSYCGCKLKNCYSVGGHVVSCKKGPFRNKWIKNFSMNNGFKGKHHTKETIERLSQARSAIIEELGVGGFKNVKWYTVKNINGEEFKVRGKWELQIANYLNFQNILWKRKIYIKYIDKDGIKRTYTPDFYIPSKNLYLEVKGYFSELDKDKIDRVISQNNINIKMLFRKDIENLNKTTAINGAGSSLQFL